MNLKTILISSLDWSLEIEKTEVLDSEFLFCYCTSVLIHTDRGTQFTSKTYNDFTKKYENMNSLRFGINEIFIWITSVILGYLVSWV